MNKEDPKRVLKFKWNYIDLLSPDPVEFSPELRIYLSGNINDISPRAHKINMSRSNAKYASIQYRNKQYLKNSIGTSLNDNNYESSHCMISCEHPSELHHILEHDDGYEKDHEHTHRLKHEYKKTGESIAEYTKNHIYPKWYAPENLTMSTFTWGKVDFLLDQDATLNVDAFAYTYNNKGELCLTEAGSCSLYLKDVFDKFDGTSDQGKDLVVQKTLKIYNANGLVKGIMVFVFSEDFISVPVKGEDPLLLAENSDDDHIDAYLNSVVSSKIQEQETESIMKEDEIFRPSSVLDYRTENKKIYNSCFKRYILANYVVFSNTNSKPTWPFMKNIHSPMYRFRGITVPGLCFTLLQDPNAANTEEYYLNLLYITLRRHYKYMPVTKSMHYFINEADDREVAVVLAELACVFSNYCNYMTDKAHTIRREHDRHVAAADKLTFVHHDTKEYPDQIENNATNLHQFVHKTSLDPRTDINSSTNSYNRKQETLSNEDEFQIDLTVNTDQFENDNEDTNNFEFENKSCESDDGSDIGENEEDESYDEEYYEIKRRIINEKQRKKKYHHSKIGSGGDFSPVDTVHFTKVSKNVDARTAQEINDPRNIQLIESFSVWLRSTKTGDCEDMAREILRHLWDIKVLKFSHPALLRLQKIRREYFALQTLKGVTSAALTDNLDDIKDMGAHMDITLVYGPYMLSLMKQFNSHEPLLEDMHEVFSFPERERALPTLVCEGTGSLKPDGTPNDSLASKLYLMRGSGSTFMNVKTMLHQELRKRSSFYKTIQSALVHDLIAEGYGIGEVVFFTRHRKHTQSDVDQYRQRMKNNYDLNSENREWDKNDFYNLMHDQVVTNFQSHSSEKEEKKILKQRQQDEIKHIPLTDVAHDQRDHEELVDIAKQTMVQKSLVKYKERVGVDVLLKQAEEMNIGNSITDIAHFSQNAKIANAHRGGHNTVMSASTYGIDHTHLMNFNMSDIMIYTMPDLTSDEIKRFSRVLKQNYPLEGMDAPREYGTLKWETKHRQTDGNILLEQVRASLRARNHGLPVSNTNVVYVDFFYKYSQINKESMRKLRNHLRKKRHVIDLFYYEEPITDHGINGEKFGGYLVRFVCRKLRAINY